MILQKWRRIFMLAITALTVVAIWLCAVVDSAHGEALAPPTWRAAVALSNPVPPTMHRSGAFYQSETVTYYADRFLVPRWFALAVTRAESDYRPRLKTWNKKRTVVLSHGMLQTNPRYESEFASAVGLARFDWRNPTQSALVGVGRLAELMSYYRGDLMLTAFGYNAGVGAVRSSRQIPAETVVYLTRIFGP